jgi:diguanylate cyclase (GGDEF)-like protein
MDGASESPHSFFEGRLPMLPRTLPLPLSFGYAADHGATTTVPRGPVRPSQKLSSFLSHHTGALDEGDELRDLLLEAHSMIRQQQDRIRHLENLAMTDELTGLLNRRGLMAELRREMAAAKRDSTACGVLVIVDLDEFKKINDTYGHPVGDAYLQMVAAVLQGEVRSADIVARLGGDEFAILLTRIDSETGFARADKLKETLHAHAFDWHGHPIPLAASFGMTSFCGAERVEDIIGQADRCLYVEKAERG